MDNLTLLVLIGYPAFAIFVLLIRYFLLQSSKIKYVVIIPIALSVVLGFSFLLYAISNLTF